MKAGIFQIKHKWCESMRELAVLRIVRLIACNVIDKALQLMKEYNIDINCYIEDEAPNISCCIDNAETFIGVAIIHSSFSSIKKLIKAGADPHFVPDIQNPLDLLGLAYIPQITKICKVKKNKTLLHYLAVGAINQINGKYKKKLSRFCLLNKFIMSDPISCNAFTFSKSQRIDMLHKNQSSSNHIFEPNIVKLTKLIEKKRLEMDMFYYNFCSIFFRTTKERSYQVSPSFIKNQEIEIKIDNYFSVHSIKNG